MPGVSARTGDSRFHYPFLILLVDVFFNYTTTLSTFNTRPWTLDNLQPFGREAYIETLLT
jgi:hypothetical protein